MLNVNNRIENLFIAYVTSRIFYKNMSIDIKMHLRSYKMYLIEKIQFTGYYNLKEKCRHYVFYCFIYISYAFNWRSSSKSSTHRE